MKLSVLPETADRRYEKGENRMNTRKHMRFLSLILVFAMVLSMMPAMTVTGFAAEDAAPQEESFLRIFHLDAGRKYFSPENIRKMIDTMAAAKPRYNYLELYFSDNQGFRLALDDMTVTTEFGTYDLTASLGDGYVEDSKTPDGSNKYLTQTEMTELIAYAKEKGIGVIPCLDMPGHMGAILEQFPDLRYTGSKSSIDLEKPEAVAFAKAIAEKYAAYFESQGCKYYNFGADEYANDAPSMGFDIIYRNGVYEREFVPFANDIAAIIKSHGMTPMCFNDGVCYNNDTAAGKKLDTDVLVCYWTSGWWGYYMARPSTLTAAGYKLVNTDGGYYWIVGGSKCTAEKAAGFDPYTFTGGETVEEPAGAMFCVWSDVGDADGQDDGAKVAEEVAPVLTNFTLNLPAPAEPEPDPDPDTTDPETTDPVEPGFPALPEKTTEFSRVFHLDAGRKYFSVEVIKQLLDTMAASEPAFNQLQLYFSDNQGFRFALNDMTVTTEFGSYDLTPALGDGYSDGSKYPDGTGKYLTQDDMDQIIAYADSKNIEVVPSMNVPGHMGAILEAFPQLRHEGSKSSIDLENAEAKAFAKAIVEKYAEYFTMKGSDHFNFGADEYANDLGSMGFEVIYRNGIYKQHFIPFFNDVAASIKERGMWPRCFNDGVYYNNDTSVKMDQDVQVCYWSSGWPGYNLGSAKTIEAQGNDLINTSDGYYWVLGNSGWQCSAAKAAQFQYKNFSGGSEIIDPAGAMFCVWCDVANADGDDGGQGVADKMTDILPAFGSTLPLTRETSPKLTEAQFPDAALLAAVKEQVGYFEKDLAGFDKVLDLSGKPVADLTGLTLLTGMTGVDLSGTSVTEFNSDMVPASVTSVDLTNCAQLTRLDLSSRPQLNVSFTGCTALQDLLLPGTAMTAVDITGMVSLRNFDISNSAVDTLIASDASAYTSAYYWNWEGAKMDLSPRTAEGQLLLGMENYFQTAELAPQYGDPVESPKYTHWFENSHDWTWDSVKKITSLSIHDYQYYGNAESVSIATSADGVEYSQVYSEVCPGGTDWVVTLPEPVETRYLRVNIACSSYLYADCSVVYCDVAPTGVNAVNQQPAIVLDLPAEITLIRDGSVHQMLDYLQKAFDGAVTFRGTPAAELAEAAWIDQAYLTRHTVMTGSTGVVITDEEGLPYVPTGLPEPDLGQLDEETNLGLTATILGDTGSTGAKEASSFIFDGNRGSKWCQTQRSGWVAFALENPAVIGKWFTEHAGLHENETYNTSEFSLQVWNEEASGVSEDALIAMDSYSRSDYMSRSEYWTDLDHVYENKDSQVTRTLDRDALKQARVYRLQIQKAEQPESSWAQAIRIFELELFGYTGQLENDTKGVFVANNIGLYNVAFVDGETELAQMKVRVRLSDQDLVDLSEAVESAKTDAETAAEAAKTAQSAAEAAQAAAETAQAAAETAKQEAEAAAAQAGENREAAEAAQLKAEEAQQKADEARAAAADAQAKAEAAQAAAETAQAASEEAAAAAEASNVEAAQQAAAAAASAREAAASAENAAVSAQNAAASANDAAASAAAAAEAMNKAQAAQAAAEAAQAAAESAQAKAEEAQKKAEEAADSSASDKENAEKAAQEAKEAQEAAESARAAAEEAQAAAEAALAAAEEANTEAAASAAQAAEYARKMAATYEEITQIKLEMVELLAKAQQAAEDAEESRKAAEEAQKKAEEAALAAAQYYALIELSQADLSGMTEGQQLRARNVIAQGRADIDAAQTPDEVDAVLADTQAKLEELKNVKTAADLFEDVTFGKWYYEGVDYMFEHGYMNGVKETVFGLNNAVTRAQMATILYRLSGSPAVDGMENPFKDVPAGTWYTDAVIWAANAGIVNGVAPDAFDPHAALTRQAMVTMLYRFDGEQAVEEDHLKDFADADKVPAYAQDAMNWAVANGLVRGNAADDGLHLDNRELSTRAQLATIMHRYLIAG